MLEGILNAAGVKNRCARFAAPPGGTYAVWFDDVEAMGPDEEPGMLMDHDCTIELYEERADDAAERAVEEQLNLRGIAWSKNGRVWIPSEQLYQVVYSFSMLEKR